MAEVMVRDETPTGREIDSWVLPNLPESITARELVRLRVREEVARFNAGEPVRTEWEKQADAACEAFSRNGFVMLVGDRQIEQLDEVIDLRVTQQVSFIRLVPLVGG